MHANQLIIAFVTVTLAISANASQTLENWSSDKSTYDLHAVASDRFSIESVQAPSFKGKAAKFTVKNDDVVGNSSGERSEVVLGGWHETSQFRVTGYEGTEYYRISVKISPDWQAPTYNLLGQRWGIFFQLHGPDQFASPPAIALHAEEQFGLFVLGGDILSKSGGRRFLSNPKLNPGKWVDFVIAVKWSIYSDGAVSVYRRDEGRPNWEKVADIQSIPTLQYRGTPALNSHYWKAGFYRSQNNQANTLWLGPILRTNSFEEATK